MGLARGIKSRAGTANHRKGEPDELKTELESLLMDTFPLKLFRWGNGFEAILIHNPISPVVAYLTQYTVGSAQEQPGQQGLAHFFEHMMFRETETLGDGDFDRIVAQSGGVGLNAFTSYDTTAYHVNVPAAQLERIVTIESDRMVNLRLSEELIDRERGAVLGEMNMYKDMPSEQLWNTLMASAFAAHPYRHPIIGYTEQVEGFQVPDFEAFYNAHYAPNRAIVVIAGGFDESEVLELLDGAYGALEPGQARPPDAEPDPPPKASKRVEIFHDKISAEFLTLAYPTPGITHADIPGLQLISALLSAGHSAPLYRALVLEGLATHVSTSLLDVDWMLSSPGLFLMEVGLQHEVSCERAEAAIDGVLKGFRRDGIPPQEFERALNLQRLAHYSSLRANMSLARYVGGFAVAQADPLFGEKLNAAVERVTTDQTMELLDRYLVQAPRVVLMQRPGKQEAA